MEVYYVFMNFDPEYNRLRADGFATHLHFPSPLYIDQLHFLCFLSNKHNRLLAELLQPSTYKKISSLAIIDAFAYSARNKLSRRYSPLIPGMMARIAATRSIVVFVVVASSLFVLSLARRTIDPLPSDAEGSASSLQALASPTLLLLLLPRGESDPSVADRDPEKRADLEAAEPLPAAAEDDDPTALAVADRRLRRSSLSCLLGWCGIEEIEAPRLGGGAGDAASLPAAEEEEAEAERAVAGANRRSEEVMGRIPKEEDGAKEKEGEKAKKKKKKRGKKPRDSGSDSDSDDDSDSDSDSDSDDDEEEDEVDGEGRREKKKEKKGEGGFLKWFWRLVNRF